MMKSWFRRFFPKSETHYDVFGNLAERKPERVWDKHDQPLAELKLCDIWIVCSNVTYIFMFARAVPEREFSYCDHAVVYAGNV